MQENINLLTRFIAYGMVMIGLFLWTYKSLCRLYYIYQQRSLKRREQIKKKENWLDRHLRFLLMTVFDEKRHPGMVQLKCFLIILFCLMFGFSIGYANFSVAFAIAVCLTMVPVLILHLLLERIRNKNNIQAEDLVADFLVQYKRNNENVLETMEAVVGKTILSI